MAAASGQSTSTRSDAKEGFDYAENVDTTSSLSTPNSSAYWDNPFAKESLGDTVIHLDKVLKTDSNACIKDPFSFYLALHLKFRNNQVIETSASNLNCTVPAYQAFGSVN